ncbi:probable methyltransferase At1g29790 [Phragmites australis]|uniref:probable methyltransferase At1g29790 n=1 Tax=Phragmites australis TaxID=29695 RepID=UPI002D798F87|nr:probable methyltransferase At1g29790 [Phragmites australis]
MYAPKHRGHSSQQQRVDAAAMGGAADGHGHRPTARPAPRRAKLKILLLVIATNIVSVYLFSGASLSVHLPASAPRIHLWDSAALLRDLNGTRAALAGARAELAALRAQCNTSSLLLESVLAGLGDVHGDTPPAQDFGGWPEEPKGELKLAIEPHRLPLGFHANFGTDELFPGLGFACRNFQDELAQYMTYNVSAQCPDDDAFALQLMLKGCEPLPRRRCRPRSPARYAEPAPLPRSLWSIPPDTTVRWAPYTCKNYTCLVERARTRGGSYFCKDCFDLEGKERRRWLIDNGGPGFSIDSVLRSRPPGTVRIGLDIGGGTGTFAARMRERDVTVVTTTLDLDAPFNRFVASRGLVPLQLSLMQRLPFADGVLDIVHTMNALSNWVPNAVLESALFDIYRVLRPGGVFWLDHFFCLGPQLNGTYVPMVDRVGFRRLRWKAGRKLDLGAERNEWYLSALLEKPMT